MDFRGKLILAPLAGVTDTTFRRLCRENGADIVVTEMVSAKGLLCDPVRSGRYLAYEEAERPVGAQLFGSDPGEIAEAAAGIARRGFDFVDINMGCPVRKVTGGGAGAAILSNPRLAGEIARAAVRAAGIPVTAKIRSGFGTEKETYLAVAEELFAAGISAVTLHPRHRGQMFAGTADWTHIAALKRAFPGEAIIGNGDVRAPGDVARMLAETGCDSVMVGRAAMGNPWIFAALDAGDRPPRRPRRSAPLPPSPHSRGATRPDPASRRGDVPAPRRTRDQGDAQAPRLVQPGDPGRRRLPLGAAEGRRPGLFPGRRRALLLSDLLRQTLESVNVGILVFDLAGKLAYINPAAEEILQGSSQALAGKHFRTLFRGSPEAVRIVRKAIEENTPVTGFDVALKPVGRGQAVQRRGAASIPVMLGVSPLSGASGDPQGAVLSVKSSEILSLVGQEERALVRAEEMQMLAYGIAHEIKNPLGGILGAAQWILRGEGPDEDRAEGVRLILREARRINDLVEKMLEMGKTPPPSRPFPLPPLLREAEQLLLSEARAQGKEVRFDLRVDPSLPPVSGHPDTVYRALLNILKNAVEAIERSGTVGIEARMNVNYRFARGRGRKRSFLEVEITDNGKGMTDEELRKALLPFYTTKARGTGLGLVMARQAVTRLGGKMEIRSSPGAGTTVILSLPVDPGRKAAT